MSKVDEAFETLEKRCLPFISGGVTGDMAREALAIIRDELERLKEKAWMYDDLCD